MAAMRRNKEFPVEASGHGTADGKPNSFPRPAVFCHASQHPPEELLGAGKPAEAYCTLARLLLRVHKIETGLVSANYDKIFWGTNCKTNDILRSD